jgi:uncharacterized protein YbjT (DUF2867 family)
LILVTGATGNIGRQVIGRLRASGQPIRALSRDPIGARLPQELDVVGGDLSEPESLGPALDDVDTVFLVWPQGSADDPGSAIAAIADRDGRVIGG